MSYKLKFSKCNGIVVVERTLKCLYINGLAEVWLVQMVKSNKSLLFRTEVEYLVLLLKG